MTTVDDVAAESGLAVGEVLAGCRVLNIVASSGASGVSADEHRRLRTHLGASDLDPVPAGSTTSRPGAGPAGPPPSLEARAAELSARRPRVSARTLSRIGLIVFLLIAVSVSVVVLPSRADEPAARCVDLRRGRTEPVPCEQPHDAEVLALQPFSDGPFPGERALGARAEARCGAALAERLAPDVAGRGLALVFLVPTAAGWSAGDRWATCLVEDPRGPLVGAVTTDP